jgi:hypothetical protein
VLLNIIEDTDGDKAREAREELEELFEKKYREYEEEEKNFYNSLLPRVKHIPITEEYNEYNNHIKKISEKAQAFYELNKDKYKNNLSSFSRLGQEWMFIYEDPKATNPQPHKDFREYRQLYTDLKRL